MTNVIVDARILLVRKSILYQSKSIIFTNLINRMGDALLLKETLALPDIVEILGPRPYPLKESIREYLEELKTRAHEEEDAAVAASE